MEIAMIANADHISRRRALLGVAGMIGASAASRAFAAANPETVFAASPFRKLSDADWRKRLPDAAYRVLRREATEAPGSSPLLNEHRKGVFSCHGCDLPLFRSEWKFESGTGWPSFFRGIDTNIARKLDFAIGVPRTEYHCARCLGHQGHVFNDGPPPTGLRFCNNGVALKFVPA
jgi:peptide-methionine (R)-S-oxide reductase